MAFLNDRKREHEQRCAKAREAGDLAAAAAHAARAADVALTLAEQCEGAVAQRYVEEAEGWLDAAETMRAGKGHPARDTAATEPEGADSEWSAMPDSGVRFADIAGMADAKQAIQDMIITPLAAVENARALGVKPGGGVLLFGPPGNGKTLLARAIAGELAAPFFYATGAEIRSKWHGESEQRLRALLQRAQACPVAVLFLDEVESLFPRRSENTPVDNRLVTQFLAEVGGFSESENVLLLLGATNRPWDIDDAVFRTGRFDRKIYVGPPDVVARREILARQVKGVPGNQALELDAWSTRLAGCTGSDIVGLVDAAKRAALRRSTEGPRLPCLADVDLAEAAKGITASATPELLRQYEEFLQQRFVS
jgi:transitional endoplasmic reticulum ATPase